LNIKFPGRSGLGIPITRERAFRAARTTAPATTMAEGPATVFPLASLGRTLDIPFRARRAGRHGEESRQIRLFARAFGLDRRAAWRLETLVVTEPIAIPIAIMATAAAIVAPAILTRGPRLETTFATHARLRLAFATLAFAGLITGSEFATLAFATMAEAVAVLLLHGLRRTEGEAIRGGIEIVIIVIAIIGLAGEGGLLGLNGGSDEAVIMLGMLEIALSGHRITGEMGIARQLGVFLGNMLGGAAHLHIRTIRFIRTRQRIGPATVATPHALVLSWSHPFFLGWLCFEAGVALPGGCHQGNNVPATRIRRPGRSAGSATGLSVKDPGSAGSISVTERGDACPSSRRIQPPDDPDACITDVFLSD